MFGTLLGECVGMTDAELDEAIRVSELERREHATRRAALLAVAESRGLHLADGHRSTAGYLRATCNTADATISRDRKLARLLDAHPAVGDALSAGHISVDHAVEIARVQANRRVATLLPLVVDVLVGLAEHSSHREFADEVTGLIAKLDQDGAFDDLADAVEGRRATVVEVGGEVVVAAHGGDPVQAEHMVAIFEAFTEAEYQQDVAARRAEFGDDAEHHALLRTPAQRGFDALFAIFSAAYASPEGRRLPDLVTNLVVDEATAHEALATAGIALPNCEQVELDEMGDIVDEGALLIDLAGELADDPEAFLGRRCETSTGTPIHPSVVLRALLTDHVRRVVTDSRGVVVDYGTKQRLFTGLARQAAMLLARRCEHPGCGLPARWSQVDHAIEWSNGGRTDQRNRNIECGHHNRFKHRERMRTRRDTRGRAYTLRSDGTIILPVGERPPDLTDDELTERIHARLANLTRASSLRP